MNKKTANRKNTFRFPFDIDRRIFLLLAAIFFILSIRNVNQLIFPRISKANITNKINRHLNFEIKEFEERFNQVKSLDYYNFETINPGDLETLQNKNNSFFIIENDSLVFWSKSDRFLPQSLTSLTDSFYTYSDNGELGVFIKKDKKINNKKCTIVGKFPIYINYQVTNEIFNSFFAYTSAHGDRPEDFGYKLIPKDLKALTSYPTIKINDVPRFELKESKNFLDVTDKNFWNFFVVALPFIFFGISIHTFYKVSVKRNPALYFSLLLLTILVLRGLTYLHGFPDDFSEFHIFNPGLYGADWLNASLGDVVINVCLIFWMLFFFIMNIQNKVFQLRKKGSRIVFIVAYSVVLFLFLYWSVYTIRSIIFDGTLNFNTTNYKNISAEMFIGLGAMLMTFMNYVLGVIILNRYFNHYFPKFKFVNWLPLVGIIGAYFLVPDPYTYVIVFSCLWTSLLLYLLNLKFFATRFDFNSYKLIYWLIILSLSCVVLISYFEADKEASERLNYAEHLVRFENKNTERALLRMGEKLHSDSNFILEQDESKVMEYLNHQYLYTFESDYKTELNLLKKNGDTTNNPSNSNTLLSSNPNPNISLKKEMGAEEYSFRGTFAHWNISLTLKPILNLNRNTQLSKELELIADKEFPVYQYAYYLDNKLVKQSGLSQFPKTLPTNARKKSGTITLDQNRGYSNIIAHNKFSKQKKSVIIRKQNDYLYKISTTYAYVFTIIFIVITLYILGNVLARSNLRQKRFINLLGLTLRMRIQLSILFVELITLIIIGFFTILILNNDTQEASLNKASVASKELSKVLSQEGSEKNAIIEKNSAEEINSLMNSVDPFLEKHEVGLNIYSTNGHKILSTATKKISGRLPQLINPKALSNLKKNSKISTLQTEKIGSLEYYTIYSNLRNNLGEIIGISAVANFSSQQLIKKNNSKVVTMLINIYAFVFLLSSLFAFYITKRLTNSFSKIVTQFSKINLTEVNQPLKWPYSDEIGLLIKEYNRTLVKLENSTALLAKSERETAWREMARQIAHEIKNPLTPMSLSLQSLQIAIRRNDPKVPELTQKMTSTVLEQINVLARIASNFSEFATMTDIVARKESLLDILESTTGIYSDSEDAEFLFVLPKKDIYVFVDKVKIIRVLTNIIQNALQAIPDDKIGQIMMSVTKRDKNLIDITITDNGIGITDELKSKIFEPNFTTKSSGSGLGLAMCMDIMLKTGGDIYYESEVNEGSSFHVLLPIYTEDTEV